MPGPVDDSKYVRKYPAMIANTYGAGAGEEVLLCVDVNYDAFVIQ